MFMDFLDKECLIHKIQINTICTSESCENKLLCDICLNTHDKGHQFLISTSSLNNSVYENIIKKNEENSKTAEIEINQIISDYNNKIEYDFYLFTEHLLGQLAKSKASLIERVNNLKDTCLEELKVWTQLKFDYSKHFLDCINKNNISISNIESEANEEVEEKFGMSKGRIGSKESYSIEENDHYLEIQRENEEEKAKKEMSKLEKKKSIENPAFNSLMNTISTVMQKHLNFTNNGSPVSNLNKFIREGIDEEYAEMKRDISKICEEKINFANKIRANNCSSNLNTIATNKVGVSKRSPLLNSTQKIKIKTPNLKPESNFLSANSPYTDNTYIRDRGEIINKYIGNNITGPVLKRNSIFYSNSSSSRFYENFDAKKFNLESPHELFHEKKGSWYTIEYIEDLDYVVCGYQTGEILIFKESDLTPVKTFRPRFKKVRKIIYSPENSSIFASYDDGYIVVIYLTNFKLDHFKMSNSQIYSMELMTNQNILVFGGVEKKILFSHVINLNKVLLFYDSNEGEVQALHYDENRDVLIAAFRKNTLICFKFSSSDIIFKHEFEGGDCCGMVIKRFREDSFLMCGFFLNLHHFRFAEGGVELVESLSLNSLHLYDVYRLNDNYLLLTTYDDGKLIFVDYEIKKILKSFKGFKGAIMIKLIKNHFYVTSHSESLKRIAIK